MTDEQKSTEEQVEEGAQGQPRKPSDAQKQQPADPMDDHGGGGDVDSEPIGDGPSGGATP